MVLPGSQGGDGSAGWLTPADAMGAEEFLLPAQVRLDEFWINGGMPGKPSDRRRRYSMPGGKRVYPRALQPFRGRFCPRTTQVTGVRIGWLWMSFLPN